MEKSVLMKLFLKEKKYFDQTFFKSLEIVC